jgi:hypothetical protein
LRLDQQIGPSPKASRMRLITVLAVTEAFEQNPSVGGYTAVTKSGAPSTVTPRENSLAFTILTSSLLE